MNEKVGKDSLCVVKVLFKKTKNLKKPWKKKRKKKKDQKLT
jgi:hypothetical protein